MTPPRADRAAERRAALVDELRTQGKITSAAVEAAFRTVPRERFMPADTPLDIAYGVDSSAVTKRDSSGVALSSVSAAYIQARMLEQAELRPGHRVLEIGSGGLNAAYIAEIVGPEGRVVSVDIDPDVTDRAAALLGETGYASRVRVLVADAEHGVPDEEPFDAIIVTVGAWDISPAWLNQLAPDGMLVLPLIMNAVTRSIGFRRNGDHLIGTSTEVAGFVPMQGDGSHGDRVFLLPDANGHNVRLAFDSGAPEDMSQLDGVLATDQAEHWFGITIKHGISFADLHLWLAWHLDGFCRVSATKEPTWRPRSAGSPSPSYAEPGSRTRRCGKRWKAGAEFGARTYGRDGRLAAAAMVEQIQAWDRHGRHTSDVRLLAHGKRPLADPRRRHGHGQDPRRRHHLPAHEQLTSH